MLIKQTFGCFCVSKKHFHIFSLCVQCAGAKNLLNRWVASIRLTFFVNFQFENIAYLCENFGREGGEKGDTLEESDLAIN